MIKKKVKAFKKKYESSEKDNRIIVTPGFGNVPTRQSFSNLKINTY